MTHTEARALRWNEVQEAEIEVLECLKRRYRASEGLLASLILGEGNGALLRSSVEAGEDIEAIARTLAVRAGRL